MPSRPTRTGGKTVKPKKKKPANKGHAAVTKRRRRASGGAPRPKAPTAQQRSSAAADWGHLRADLVPCLRDLAEDEYLIISYKAVNYFVQFAGHGDSGMRVEAVCNTFLEPQARLTIEDYIRMTGLGWLLPTYEHRGRDVPEPADGSPNFFQDLPTPVDFGAVADLTCRTLQDVYRVRHPGELHYKAFTKGNVQVRFPTLRLKRSGG